MTENNNTLKPVSYEMARRFLADLHFLKDFRETQADFLDSNEPSPIYRDTFITATFALMESTSMIADALYDAYPAEFLGYCSENPQRKMTESEKDLSTQYIRSISPHLDV